MVLLYLKTLLRQLMLPPAGPLLLGLAGLLLLRRRPRLARALIGVMLAFMWLISTPLISDRILRLAQFYPALDPTRLEGAQAIAILGGGALHMVAPEYGGGPAAEADLLDKVAYGAYLTRRTGLPILITGFDGEVDAMRATLQTNFDIQPRWIDRDAYDTFENARNAAALFRRDGIERVLLVTLTVHMRRSVNEFAATGLTVVPAPVAVVTSKPLGMIDFLPNAMALLRSSSAIYELIGEPVRLMLAATHARRQQAMQ